MSQLAPQGQYTPEQMRMLLSELKKHPELQTNILHHVTQNHIADPQAIASLVHTQLLSAQSQQQAVHPFAALVSGLDLPKFEAQNITPTAQLPAPQAVSAPPVTQQGNSIG